MKTALVTGGSAGIGKVTTRELVKQGYRVLVVARNKQKGDELVRALKNDTPGADVAFFSVDLSDFEAVKAFTDQVKSQIDALDLMVLNAGLLTPRIHAAKSNHELMFATTHLGHFLLTHELLPLLKKGDAPRVVVTSSVAHHFGTMMRFFDAIVAPFLPTKKSMLVSFLHYGRSKLANLLFVRELAERLKGDGILVNAFHPGGVKTEIWRKTPGLLGLIDKFLVTEEEGADTQIFLATDPSVQKTGQYWVKRKVRFSHPKSKNQQLIKALWAYSEEVFDIDEFGSPTSK